MKATKRFLLTLVAIAGMSGNAVMKADTTYPLLSKATSADYGKVVCAAGHLHTAKTAVPTGCTAVGILGKVTETGKGLILSLRPATANQTWNTIDGWTSDNTYAGTTLKLLPDAALAPLASYTKLGDCAVSGWAVAQKADYEAIFANLGSKQGDEDGLVFDANVNAYLTPFGNQFNTTNIFWSASKHDAKQNFAWTATSSWWAPNGKTNPYIIWPVLGFEPKKDTGGGKEVTLALTPTANANEWTLTMPDGDVELQVEYYATKPYDLTLTDGSEAHGKVTFTVGGETVTKAEKGNVVTVSIKHDAGFEPQKVKVRAYTTWDAAGARRRDPALQDDITATKQLDGTWTFTMPEANVKVTVVYTKDVKDEWIQAIADRTYTGQAIEPTVSMKDDEDTEMVLGTDYTVAYSDNTEVGQATVTGSGIVQYSGTATATFNILPDKTKLKAVIDKADEYYESIKDIDPEAAFMLQIAIYTAKNARNKFYATQAEVDAQTENLTKEMEVAKADVALKRVKLTIPAKSYVTYIDAEKRQMENAVSGVSLHTVTGINGDEVTLSSPISVVQAEMPFLFYNDNDAEASVSIIVSSTDADNVQYDSQHYKGTLTDKTFTDEDMQAADHYVLMDGQDFVWVRKAGTLAAGKCWIELAKASPQHAPRLTIVPGTTTGISHVATAEKSDALYYDLQGRRVTMPTKKGLFIVGGKKVVIK